MNSAVAFLTRRQWPAGIGALAATGATAGATAVTVPVLAYHRFLFVHPSAVSNASYAMTWEQLRGLQATGRYRIESHTFWHSNFRIESIAPRGRFMDARR